MAATEIPHVAHPRPMLVVCSHQRPVRGSTLSICCLGSLLDLTSLLNSQINVNTVVLDVMCFETSLIFRCGVRSCLLMLYSARTEKH